jgi:lysyl-tRNA synthetase class 2
VAEESSDLIRQRLKKLDDFRARGVDPYPYSYRRTHTAAEVIATFGDTDAASETGCNVAVAGRMMTRRLHGKSAFAHLLDGTKPLQIYARQDVLGESAYGLFTSLDLGDVIGVEGSVFRTRTGELTVLVKSWTLLAKSLRPLPEKWHGLQDVETRYRQRYADLIVNPDVREVFRKRALIVQAIRERLNARGYLEVETPVLQPLYGGAAARPFTTRHNALDRTLYLRISNELYLKRLIVGGFERVYEFSRDFRNEGIDRSHNPEFTLMECYEAYADYEDMMRLAEELVAHAAETATGSTTVTYQDNTLDLTPPWRRLSMTDSIRQVLGVDVTAMTKGQLQALVTALVAKNGQTVPLEETWGGLIAQLFEECVEATLVQPTIIYDYPVEVSPLAKRKRGDDRFVERFEPYVARMELGNAFSELNDPVDQRARFEDQASRAVGGDAEAHPLDEDYLRALEYGMPPTGGLGIGIDRLTMLLTDSATIRDVILFPQMRPET